MWFTVSAQVSVSIAHRYYNPSLSEEENFRLYGEDTRLHGHDYIIEVLVSKEMDEVGFSVHTVRLKELLTKEIRNRFDHRYLNEMEEFKGIFAPTMEQFLKVVWNILFPRFTEQGIRLEAVRLHEGRDVIEYRGT